MGCRPAQRLLARDARFQPPQQMHTPLALHGLPAMEDVRQVNVGAAPHEARRHHADHRPHLVVQPQLAAQHAGVAAELPLPELVAQHRHRLRAIRGIGRPGARPISGGTPITSNVFMVQ